MTKKRPLWRLKEGDIITLSLGDNREATLRVLFRWRRGVDMLWVYPDEAASVPVDQLTDLKPLGLVGALGALIPKPEYAPRIRRLGACALAEEEKLLPVFCWGSDVYQRDRLVLPVDWDDPHMSTYLAIRAERFPSLGVAAFEALVLDVRERLGLEEQRVLHTMERLRSPSEATRHAATVSLGWLGRVGARPAIDELIHLLYHDESHVVRRGAARALGHVGYGRAVVRKALETSRNDAGHPEVREAAADAIRALERGYYELDEGAAKRG